jgi:hypothetical protein
MAQTQFRIMAQTQFRIMAQTHFRIMGGPCCRRPTVADCLLESTALAQHGQRGTKRGHSFFPRQTQFRIMADPISHHGADPLSHHGRAGVSTSNRCRLLTGAYCTSTAWTAGHKEGSQLIPQADLVSHHGADPLSHHRGAVVSTSKR